MTASPHRIATVAATTPFGQRLAPAFGYPLRGAALATCVALALSHLIGLLPGAFGTLASLAVWGATWRYAAECLLHTANGFANPPDVGDDEAGTAGWALSAIHLFAFAMCLLCTVFEPPLTWPVLMLFVLALPAIDMTLAFDGNLALALHPLHLIRIVRGFGIAYLVPVALNLLLGISIAGASVATAHLPAALALPLFGFVGTYLVVLCFHLMGALIHVHHTRFGLEPSSARLIEANGQDADTRLLADARRFAVDDPLAALRLLAGRLQDRAAPAALHAGYRELLRSQQRRDDLLVHGQIWIAALIAGGDGKRALGLVQECIGYDPAFLPDDPSHAGTLAELAARLGMARLAVHLATGFLDTWPRDTRSPQYGLLAARLLGTTLAQPAEARQLLDRLDAVVRDPADRAQFVALATQLARP